MVVAKEFFSISHVLIDCENVGLNGLLDLVVQTDGSPIKFVLFHNASNKLNIPLDKLKDLTNAVTEGRLESIGLSIPQNMTKKQAENALDFYIAFYMGQVMPREPFDSHCVILSKDRDYDPLILHVQKEFDASRCERIDSYEKLAKRLGFSLNEEQPKVLPTVRKMNFDVGQLDVDVDKFVPKVKKLLDGMAKNLPSTKIKLQRTIKSWLMADKLTDADILQIIKALQNAGHLSFDANGNKLQYK